MRRTALKCRRRIGSPVSRMNRPARSERSRPISSHISASWRTLTRGCDENATRSENARELRETPVEIGDVVEHEVRDGRVEARSREGQLLDVADARVDSSRRRQLGHARRLVDRDDLDPGSDEGLGKLASAAAHLDHPLRCRGHRLGEGNLLWLGPGPSRPEREPRREPRLVGIFAPHGVRVVLPGYLTHDIVFRHRRGLYVLARPAPPLGDC